MVSLEEQEALSLPTGVFPWDDVLLIRGGRVQIALGLMERIIVLCMDTASYVTLCQSQWPHAKFMEFLGLTYFTMKFVNFYVCDTF
jgi:hypothetical protein